MRILRILAGAAIVVFFLAFHFCGVFGQVLDYRQYAQGCNCFREAAAEIEWLTTERGNQDRWAEAGSSKVGDTRTQCGSTISAGASAATINSQIAGCSANQYVLLGAGTFNLTSGINLEVDNVTLRGSGPDSTILDFSGGVSCDGLGAVICMGEQDANIVVDGTPNSVNWTAGYAQNTATITVASSPSGLQVGDIALLDQTNDACSDRTSVLWFVTQEGPGDCLDEGGGTFTRESPNRAHSQYSIITSIDGTSIGIDPPLINPAWDSGEDPELVWSGERPGEGMGLEDLRIDATDAGSQWSVTVIFCKECFVRNVHMIGSDRAQVLTFQSIRGTIRDSYFYEAQAGASQSYGIELSAGTNWLIENNIVHKHAGTITANAPSVGNVIAYNYLFNQEFTGEMIHSVSLHEAGVDGNLFEGNIMYPGVRGDDIHGTHNASTFLRNYMRGRDPVQDKEGTVVYLQPSSRHFNLLGNVLGDEAVHDTYANSGLPIYSLGQADSPVLADSDTSDTLYRWCNYDVVNAAVRSESSEVPTAISEFPQPSPGTCTGLPASFYTSYAAVGAWWNTPSGEPAFPPIGPDVSGGDIDIDEPANTGDTDLAGHVHKIPAFICYEDCTKDGNGMCTDFDADSCYIAVE